MKEKSNKCKAIHNILENYQQVEKSIVDQLYMKHDIHGTTIGSSREDIWEELFRMVIPKKFVMEHSVFVIDANSGISKEVDLVIMDEMYTPYIFHYGRLKFIPIEAVAAVIECKSKGSNKEEEEGIREWFNRVKTLETADESIARIVSYISYGPVPTQKATRPICILCTMNKSYLEKLGSDFDFIIYAERESKKNEKYPRLIIQRNKLLENLWQCYITLNNVGYDDSQTENNMKPGGMSKKELENILLDECYKVKDQDGKENVLLTFNMQLNQMLMLINNPMPFPHQSYVKMFNKYACGEKEE